MQTPAAQDRPEGPIPVPGAQQLPPELSVRPTPRPEGPSLVHPSRPAQAGAGLTAQGVFVVVGAVSLVAMVVDTFTGGGVGWLFGGFFVAVSVYAALQVRRTDLVWAVIAPPLVFAVLVCGHAFFTTAGDVVSRIAILGNALFDYGPMLWIGVGLAAAIVAWRRWRR